jgi:hypothetical protein
MLHSARGHLLGAKGHTPAKRTRGTLEPVNETGERRDTGGR